MYVKAMHGARYVPRSLIIETRLFWRHEVSAPRQVSSRASLVSCRYSSIHLVYTRNEKDTAIFGVEMLKLSTSFPFSQLFFEGGG